MTTRDLAQLAIAAVCIGIVLHRVGVFAWLKGLAVRLSSTRPPAWLEKQWANVALVGIAAFCVLAVSGVPSLPSIQWPKIEWPSIGPAVATHFIVLHEATKDDARFGELAQELQDFDSPVSKEIAAAGWDVDILDDNQTTGTNQPHPTLAALGLFDTIDDGRRELVAFNPPASLVAKEPIPADATAETVLAMIRAKGKR